MKREFIVSKIEASQDERKPFVYVVFTDTKIAREGKQHQSLFGDMGITFTSREDLMKNFTKMFSGGRSVDSGESPIFKLSIREYEESSLSVGDKVTIEIKKLDSSGI
jgi:hypothetical protein